jgi:hypothetical protein
MNKAAHCRLQRCKYIILWLLDTVNTTGGNWIDFTERSEHQVHGLQEIQSTSFDNVRKSSDYMLFGQMSRMRNRPTAFDNLSLRGALRFGTIP